MKSLSMCLLSLLLAPIGAIAIAAATPETEETDSILSGDNVQLGISCGTLKGTGAVIVVDKVKNKMYKLPFTCPAFTI